MRFCTKNKLIGFILLFILSNFIFAQTAFKIPEKPSKIYPVNDYTGTLSESQKKSLNEKLIAYNDSTSTEVIVCVIKTLTGDDINYVAAQWGNKWGIGQNKVNNGIILLIAVDDGELAIQNGRGTEDAMTDAISSQIINQYMIPYLRQGDYNAAINSGVDQIINVLQGKFKSNPKNTEDTTPTIVFIVLGIIFFLLFIQIIKSNKGGTTYNRRGKNDDDFWGTGGGFFGGGFGGGSSGGGFGGFGGGGSFGGGGASGKW